MAADVLTTAHGASALPPGPPSALLSTAAWIFRPAELLRWCLERYGPQFTLRFPGIGPVVFFASPAAVRQLLEQRPRLSGGAANEILRPLVGDASMLVSDGARHQRQRREVLEYLNEARDAARFADSVRKVTARWRPGASVDVAAAMDEVSLEVLLDAVVRFGSAERRRAARSVLASLVRTAGPALVFLKVLHAGRSRWTPAGKVLAKAAELREIVRREMEERRARGPAAREDLIDRLLRARGDDGEPLAPEEVCDQVVTTLVSGHVTTPTAMTWALFHVLSDAAALARAEGEARGPGPSPPYIEAACLEALRLRPVIPVLGRVASEPVEVCGYTLPAGVLVAACSYLVHRDAGAYAAAERFDPTRFLGRHPEPGAYLPFGTGARRCPGERFALVEMETTLRTILGGFRLALARREVGVGHGRSGVTFVPRQPLRARVERLL